LNLDRDRILVSANFIFYQNYLCIIKCVNCDPKPSCIVIKFRRYVLKTERFINDSANISIICPQITFKSRLEISPLIIRLDQQLTKQTQKYLQKMAKREQRLQRKLSAVDSNAAKTLFSGSAERYAALEQRLKADTGSRVTGLAGR